VETVKPIRSVLFLLLSVAAICAAAPADPMPLQWEAPCMAERFELSTDGGKFRPISATRRPGPALRGPGVIQDPDLGMAAVCTFEFRLQSAPARMALRICRSGRCSDPAELVCADGRCSNLAALRARPVAE
jgi:hypothetical protein